jgi:hypothetical protein
MLTCARHRRYWWTGMSTNRVLTSEESLLCGLNTNVVILQLEDPFGYDRADIKVDAIVEDLRVRTALSSRPTPASALAKPQAQVPTHKTNTELIYQPTGGDECIDRRVEKGLGHVRRLGGRHSGRYNHGARRSPHVRDRML